MNKTNLIPAQKHLSTWVIALMMTVLFVAIISGLAGLMADGDLTNLPMTIKTSAVFIGSSFILAVMAVAGFSRVSIWNVTSQILPVWFTLTLVMGILLMVFRLDYSTVFLGVAWAVGLGLLTMMGRILSRQPNLCIGVLDGVDQEKLMGREIVTLDPDMPVFEKLDLVIATTDGMKDPRYAAMLSQLAGRRIPVLPEQTYYEQQTGRVDHHHVDAAELMQLRPYRRYIVLKRMSDIIMAFVGLILFAPVMLIVAVMIKTESSGPTIFVQRRVGESGREFKMYKFRSMVQDAEKSGAKFATATDARITRLGRIIRKLRIDELPQLINVLMGTMSMIGPRPEQKAFVDDLEKQIPLYPIRHAVRPGITGWAQVMQGYADDVSSTDVKLSYDLFYIKNLSLMMDMVIFFKTIKTIITGFGAR